MCTIILGNSNQSHGSAYLWHSNRYAKSTDRIRQYRFIISPRFFIHSRKYQPRRRQFRNNCPISEHIYNKGIFHRISNHISKDPKQQKEHIVLSNDTFILEGVVITAKRPDYQIKDGNLVTRIENSLLSKSGTGNDVLKHIPGIQEKKEIHSIW